MIQIYCIFTVFTNILHILYVFVYQYLITYVEYISSILEPLLLNNIIRLDHIFHILIIIFILNYCYAIRLCSSFLVFQGQWHCAPGSCNAGRICSGVIVPEEHLKVIHSTQSRNNILGDH